VKTLRMINDGFFKVGGFKSRGFGLVKLTDFKMFYSPPKDKLDDFDEVVASDEKVYEGSELDNLFNKFVESWDKYVKQTAKS